jgi:outer membrane protein OmpA-like peptidoglycan-associated protein
MYHYAFKGGIMNKHIFSALIIGILCINSYADETDGKTEIGIKGGVNSYWGDINDRQVNGSAALSLFWWLSDPFALGINGGASFLQAEQGQSYFKTMLYSATPMIKVKLFPSSPLNPYLQTGFEIMYINPQAKDGSKLPNNAAGDYENLQYAVPFGGGLSVFLSEVVAIELEAMYHQALTDYLDDIKKGDRYDGYMTLTLGLTFNLGKPKDSDRDGIPDKIDGDPTGPEDYDGFEDADGIPDPDNDQDGIPDYSDMARNEPEDHDGFEDKDGVPDPDNDADGILDINDKMPGTDATLAAGIITIEDVDGFQDEDGAPDPDNDGDGILDVDDKCPNQPETFNEYQDEDGCPDSKPEIEVGQSIILEGVNFASGSSELEPNSKRILDNVVLTLKKNPEIEVEIRGYTDNTGSYQGNINISKRRAETVKNYLIQQDIAPYRIITKGFGPENPVASNATREGRAKNRRIEFYRIK